MSRDPSRDELPNPKKWDDSDNGSQPEAMDLEQTKRAGSATEVKNKHRSPEVKLRNEPRGQQYDDQQSRSYWETFRYTLEAFNIKLKGFLSRVVQLLGFYLVFAAVIDMFGVFLQSGGIPVNSIPSVLWEPYLALNLSPVFALVIGLGVVWFSTSVWFLS